MRNFLFAASMAERDRKSHFWVLTIGPRLFAPVLASQVEAFRRDVLQDAFAERIAFLDYEGYIGILGSSGDPDAAELARFLEERISTIVSR